MRTHPFIAVIAFALSSSALASPCTPGQPLPNANINPNNQTVAEASLVNGVRTPTTVTLNGGGSRGAVFSWAQTGGPSVTLSDSTSDKPTFTAPNVGPGGDALTFSLTVKCSATQTNTSSVSTTVSITNFNAAPTADAGTDDIVNEGALVTLSGSGSDPDGDTLTYSWTQTAGPAVTLSNGGLGAVVTFTAPNVGVSGATLKFSLRVSDGNLPAFDEKIVNVMWVNVPPDPVLVCTPSVSEGGLVTLDGSGSFDEDDGIASFYWEQLSGPPDSGIGGSTTSSVSFNAPQLGFSQTGLLTFRLTVTDNHGLSSSEKCSVAIVDATPPVVTTPTLSPVEATMSSGAQVSFSVTAEDLRDGPVEASCSPASGSIFALGNATVSCQATDRAGNTGTASFVVNVRDTTAPSFSAPADITAEATGPTGAAVTYTSPNTFDAVSGAGMASCAPISGSTFALGGTSVSCTATDGASNTSSRSFTVNVVDTTPPTIAAHDDVNAEATSSAGAAVSYAAPSTTDLVDGTGTATCTPASGSTFAIGTTTVTCNATDAHNNHASATTFKVIVKDSTPPTIAPHGDVTAEATSAAGAAVSYTSPATSDLVDGAGVASCLPASGSTFALGTTIVTCNATDAHGNAATATTFNVIVQDNTPPTIATHGDETTEATGANGAIVTYTPPATSDLVDGAGTATCLPASGTQLALGTHTVTCNAKDAHNNQATATTFKVTVKDSTPPTIAAHDNVVAEATGPTGAVVSYASPSTSDLVDGAGTATCSAASGTLFGLGDTTVTCNATDAAGNAATATTFTVTVRDTTPPVIASHGDVTGEATSANGANVSYSASTTSDAVDGAGVASCVPASGSLFPLGATTVTCTAKDAHNNSAAPITFKVNVVDTMAPILTVPGNIVKEATGSSGAAATFAATATDAVTANPTVSCSPNSGSTFAIGTTTVNCTATDGAGNSSQGSFTVKVQDTTAPSIAPHADVTAFATSGAGAAVSYALPTASDIVDGTVAVSCSPSSGSQFPVGESTVSCSATDRAGNTGTSSFKVIVSYNFNGFFQPINNNALNSVKAGSAIPVKFNLGGNMGLDIFAAGYPRVVAASCSAAAVEEITDAETVTAGGSSLSYDAAANQYVYVWKSDKSWSGRCLQLQVKLRDGSTHVANFGFTK